MSLPSVFRIAGAPLWVLAMVGAAAAGPATDQLRPDIERVVTILETPALRGDAKAAERRQAIRAITDGAFDWNEMARRSLGRHWEARTPAERREFVALFRDLLERAYIAKIEKYGGERLAYTGERTDGDEATVQTRVETRPGQDVAIDYRLNRRGERWLIIDVLVEGVSLVGNYRTQFDGIIKTTSFDELLRKIRSRAS